MDKYVIVTVSQILSGQPFVRPLPGHEYDTLIEAIANAPSKTPSTQHLIVRKIDVDTIGNYKDTKIVELL